MARKYQTHRPTGFTVLVVDDSPDILESTSRLLEAEGHRVITAANGPLAIRLLGRERVSLILLDYFMPGMSGDEVVRRIRETDSVVQIVLVTGYAGEKPARLMMRQLDIQGYHDKSDDPERLLLWVDVALNTYRHACAAERHRVGLRFMLDAAPQMYEAQSLERLLERLLVQVSELQGVEDVFLATLSPELIGASVQNADESVGGAESREGSLEIRFGAGRFQGATALDALSDAERSIVMETLRRGTIEVRGNRSVIPLRLSTRPIGIIYIDRGVQDAHERELLEVFGNHAAAAIHNALLSKLAATDSLTGIFTRGFAMRRLNECLKATQRAAEPVSVLMVDVNRFKDINDHYGHYVGDQALGAVAALLQRSVRETDVVGRYGGDEFVVALPNTSLEGAGVVGRRILRHVERLVLRGSGESIPLPLSLGVGTLPCVPEDRDRVLRAEDFVVAARELVARADRALYTSKRTGRVEESPPLFWADVLAFGATAAPAKPAGIPVNTDSEQPRPDTFAHRGARGAEPVAASNPGSDSCRRLRLLVVDDEETVRRSLVRYLKRRGHEVTEAGDGIEALRLLDGAPAEAGYDLILSDLRMPGLTGDQLLLKLQERNHELCRRMIFLTGDEPSGDAARILAAAGCPLLLKPYDLGEISRLIERLCGGDG